MGQINFHKGNRPPPVPGDVAHFHLVSDKPPENKPQLTTRRLPEEPDTAMKFTEIQATTIGALLARRLKQKVLPKILKEVEFEPGEEITVTQTIKIVSLPGEPIKVVDSDTGEQIWPTK